MDRWNIKPSTLIILASVVLVMLLIVVLPDVDLPDTAFHRGTAPVVLHSQATSAPAVITVLAVFQFPDAAETYRPFRPMDAPIISADPNSRPILLRSIRR